MKNIEALKSLIENNKAELEKLESLLAEAIEENKKEEIQELVDYAQVVDSIIDWMVEKEVEYHYGLDERMTYDGIDPFAMKRHIHRMIMETNSWTAIINNSKIQHWQYLVSFMIENCPAGDRVLLSIENCATHSRFKNMWKPAEIFTLEMDFSNKNGALRSAFACTTEDDVFGKWEINSYEIRNLLVEIKQFIDKSDCKFNQEVDSDAIRNLHL